MLVQIVLLLLKKLTQIMSVYFRKVISLLSDYTEYTAYTEYTDYADNTENTENTEYTEYPLAKILQTVLTLAPWDA